MKTAWYIDDDQEMITAITMMMKLLDFTVRPFLKAQEAAKLLIDGKRPDILILDINMPQVSGIDMLEFVRRRAELTDLPIIMLSSEFTDVQVDEALSLGADAYAFKPVTVDELEAAIDNALKRRRNVG